MIMISSKAGQALARAQHELQEAEAAVDGDIRDLHEGRAECFDIAIRKRL